MRLDFLWLLLIKLHQLIPSGPVRPQQFIQFGVDSLRVSMLRTLDEQGHEERRNRRPADPIERLVLKKQPSGDVERHHNERNRMRGATPREVNRRRTRLIVDNDRAG